MDAPDFLFTGSGGGAADFIVNIDGPSSQRVGRGGTAPVHEYRRNRRALPRRDDFVTDPAAMTARERFKRLLADALERICVLEGQLELAQTRLAELEQTAAPREADRTGEQHG